MNLADIIGQVAGGGILGLAGSLANSWLNLKANREQNRHTIQLLRLKADVATIEGEARAFTASQESASADVVTLPANVTSAPLQWLAIGTQALRTATRPLLTWTLVFVSMGHPELSGLAAMAVSWWFGSRSSAFLTDATRK